VCVCVCVCVKSCLLCVWLVAGESVGHKGRQIASYDPVMAVTAGVSN